MRAAWLNPPDLVERVTEVVPGYPDRIVPVNPKAAAIPKKRTLANLYNERPTWLDNAHRDLDAAVATAYGWPADIGEEGALAQLLALNLKRSATAPTVMDQGVRKIGNVTACPPYRRRPVLALFPDHDAQQGEFTGAVLPPAPPILAPGKNDSQMSFSTSRPPG